MHYSLCSGSPFFLGLFAVSFLQTKPALFLPQVSQIYSKDFSECVGQEEQLQMKACTGTPITTETPVFKASLKVK